ncbi:hypothetical protein [Aquibacillus rhizosphaerae]|uniref:Uncharacterized protein n=1 Tax=Aquibacillus rhizosphaerae TaxID=3051431 RepID=A0ABT7L1R6_9BACI|nr:hypothetical protein [Aquibacillus sp. LR5S19]MDL4839799.1 hypothetical protein [Aquibacillus sp. LR5S19]
MTNKNNKTAENIKDTAGAAFHTVHSALETTEDAAMSAVDATAEAIENAGQDTNKKK